MKCDLCQNDATVHEVVIRGGKKVEKHLCETCALSHGVSPAVPTPITQLLTQYVTAQAKASRPRHSARTCENCGLTYARFRQAGLLGCMDCYDTFEPHLATLISRAHEGGSHHVGKVPRRFVPPEERETELPPREVRERTNILREKIEMLGRQLGEAVASEQYERAAQLRDQLRHLEQTLRGSGGVGPGDE